MSGRGRFRGNRVRPVVYVHIGAPKTGTTFLQQVLWHNRTTLARDGMLYPAEPTGDHFRAALDLRGVRFRGYDDPEVPGSWQRVVDRTHRWRGPTTVISHELLAWASKEQARAAVESLHPAEVHVVYTARDLARQLPAMWQEEVKNGGVAAFVRYLRSVEAPGRHGRFGREFWGAQDAGAVLGRWGAAVPSRRVHVLTVPRPDAPSDLLWRRFADLVGCDPDGCDTNVDGSNVSLGRAEVELLRKINCALDGKLDWPQYEALVKRWLAETILAASPTDGRISLPPIWYAWAVERSEQLVAGLRDAGYHVVGELGELIPSPPPPAGDDTLNDGTVDADQLDVTAAGIASLLQRVARMPKTEWPRTGQVRQLEEELARRRRQPVRTFVRDVSERRHAVKRARMAWWRGAELARGLGARLVRRTRSGTATRRGCQ